jgi:hypothetical protein
MQIAISQTASAVSSRVSARVAYVSAIGQPAKPFLRGRMMHRQALTID